MVMRFIPLGVPRFEELNLPEVIARLAQEERGAEAPWRKEHVSSDPKQA